MKRLDSHSQNFLRSPRLVGELIGHSNIKKTDVVLDVGAGSGVISSVLAGRSKQVLAYELDPRMAAKLRDNTAKFNNVQVIGTDFLEASLPSEPYKVFANIPFHLSSPILKKLTESPQHPKAIYLIVQKQFAQKLCIDKPGFTGMLGAQIAPLYTARIRKPLRKTDFYPHPAVDTVLLELKLRPESLLPEKQLPQYRDFIAKCFADPKIFAKTNREKATIALDLKPSMLSTEQWLALFLQQ